MTNKEITILVRQIIKDAFKDFFSDPDLGKEVRSSFLKSVDLSKNNRNRKSLTIAQFRKKYGY